MILGEEILFLQIGQKKCKFIFKFSKQFLQINNFFSSGFKIFLQELQSGGKIISKK